MPIWWKTQINERNMTALKKTSYIKSFLLLMMGQQAQLLSSSIRVQGEQEGNALAKRGLISCPLLHLGCFLGGIAAGCRIQRHAPEGDSHTLALLAGRCSLASMTFTTKVLQGAATAYYTRDSSWQGLQRFLLKAATGSLLHEKEACGLPIASETFALTWLFHHRVPDVQGTEP